MSLYSKAVYILLGILIGSVGSYVIQQAKTPRVHKLQFPLALSGGTVDSPAGILPKGTSLYYDQAFPEGFVRYRVYVNVEGVKLEAQEVTDPLWIDPLAAFPLERGELHQPARATIEAHP
ncbi:hypothetical protein LBW59_17200 [Ralstonia solanacearum]|uniref:GDYXXLXY domain-containing protein n=1 Tax=Ralstonia solanacearum TaxID=305 RepID=A0AAW5ZSD7_RALSL|nr:hypothetical protein [Ralstonia solanacearum]MDB0572498.1 hypothetical protein [Ralstonia solanacearum]